MKNILFSADWHIKLATRNIPDEWQRNRFLLMVDSLNKIYKEKECNLHIIGGDILDVSDPSTAELDLYFEVISRLEGNILIFSGNHEMISNKLSCLSNLKAETLRCNPKANVLVEPYRSTDFDVIDYIELHKKDWIPSKSKLCFTHVRGAIAPHVKPEINLNKFKTHGYDLVIAGDLHSVDCSQNTPDIPLLYPGSPMNTSFSREQEPKKTHGVFVVDPDTLIHEWIELVDLPQLIRKKVGCPSKMVADKFHRVIYELEGDVVDLGKVKNSELLDKKINKNITKDAKLPSLDGNLDNEVSTYCAEILGLDTTKIQDIISELHNSVILDTFEDD